MNQEQQNPKILIQIISNVSYFSLQRAVDWDNLRIKLYSLFSNKNSRRLMAARVGVWLAAKGGQGDNICL